MYWKGKILKFYSVILMTKTNLDLGRAECMIVNWIEVNYDRCQQRDFDRNNNEQSRFVKRWEFTTQLCDCQLLTLASDPLKRSGCVLLPNRYVN